MQIEACFILHHIFIDLTSHMLFLLYRVYSKQHWRKRCVSFYSYSYSLLVVITCSTYEFKAPSYASQTCITDNWKYINMCWIHNTNFHVLWFSLRFIIKNSLFPCGFVPGLSFPCFNTSYLLFGTQWSTFTLHLSWMMIPAELSNLTIHHLILR